MTDFGRRSGDMFKSDYDTNDNDVVDNASKLAGSTKGEVQNHAPQTHNHTESQISDLDHDALKIKGVIINDAAIADQKVLAYDSGTQRIIYIEQAPSGAVIESIQMGEISLTSGNASNTATITEVDLDKSVLLHLGQRTGAAALNHYSVMLALTDATTVTATRGGTDQTTVVRFAVIEFSSGIASVQRGNIQLISELSETATISSVDVDKAFVSHTGCKTAGAAPDQGIATLELENATTVKAEAGVANASLYCGYEVMEFS